KNFPKNTMTGIIGYGLLISLVTIIIRILWVFAGAYHQFAVKRNANKASQEEIIEPVSWKNVLIVAWTGTRGVVSMATALALPLTLKNGSHFPQRELMLFLAFIVILVTLVVQGLTLPLLIKWLNIKPVAHVQKQEEKDLQLLLTENILNYLNGEFPIELDHNVMDQLRKRYEVNFNLLSNSKNRNQAQKAEKVSQLIYKKHMIAGQLEIVKYQRNLLLKYQKEGTFNEDAISKAEQELDIEELRLNTLVDKKNESNKKNIS
ncbi:MAG: cation:proton antiporter, partial [Ginsengibacter sp.]